MGENDWPAERSRANRSRLRVVACRMPGSLAEADDAGPESWLRLIRWDTQVIAGPERLRQLD